MTNTVTNQATETVTLTNEERASLLADACRCGVRNLSYSTPSAGRVAMFRGEATVSLPDGRRFRAVGCEPEGTAHAVTRQGGVRFLPVD